ncbi:hypothetical protein JXM83_06055 [Candidatus Woesearchaeota archaeon]|nr:hypothetical protein [Candidatus Woesearchaeota archaeon]
MNFSKKAQGMSLNMVVVAAIALIVLVVLTAIFASKIRTSTQEGEKSTNNILNQACETDNEYRCSSNSGCVQKGGATKPGSFVDCGSTQYCCPVSNS